MSCEIPKNGMIGKSVPVRMLAYEGSRTDGMWLI